MKETRDDLYLIRIKLKVFIWTLLHDNKYNTVIVNEKQGGYKRYTAALLP